jgi:RNA-directed DNA polymerase
MMRQDPVALNLAAALLNGVWSEAAMTRRLAEALGRRERWLRPLARRVLATFGTSSPPPRPGPLAEFIRRDAGYRRGNHRFSNPHRLYWVPEVMAPRAGAPATWNVPALTSPGALAEWLGLSPGEMDWFADCQGRLRQAASAPLQHYTYRWLTSRRGKARLLEIPKARLKEMQRRILHELLDAIPPHAAAHGYRRGRSIVSHVTPHTSRPVVVHLDLRQFFPSIGAARVRALFRTAGYPPAVARLLAGICTNVVPIAVLEARPTAVRPADADAEGRYLWPHLPQGAPTSPALANLCAYRLDCRLAGLSRKLGAEYTRYADDLVFSGDEVLQRSLRRFHIHVCRMALEEGFEINTRKSHFMRQGVRQQVAGIVLNARPNVPRAEYDRLKAILTNCFRHGPDSQNRDRHPDWRAHLVGRVAYVAMIHPSRGQRLRELLARITWAEENEKTHGEDAVG